jgi:hypothetical protein
MAMVAFRLEILVLCLAFLGLAVNAPAESLEECVSACDVTAVDVDGDGLDSCVETCLGTSDLVIDSDGDGMADNFEFVHALDPKMDDGGEDADGDDMSNLDEFMENADPADPASPYVMVYVAPDGSDRSGLGTAAYPWRSIGRAMAQIEQGGILNARVLLRGGVYTEDVTLVSDTMLSGETGAETTIIGLITGAQDATLKNITLEPAAGQFVLLDMNDVAMNLSDVTFLGSEARDVTGILLDGNAPAASVIDRCTFTRLGVGIDIGGGHPSVRRSTFSNIPAAFGEPLRPGAGIIIRPYDNPVPDGKSMGDETNPAEGWNDFLASIEGFAVINERDEVVTMQGNYWGTTNPEEFPNRVSGSAVVLPVLAQSSAVLASSIFCTVWDSTDQKRIGSAAITLAISSFNEVTGSADGVYAFPAVSEGTYSLIVNAPGYEQQEQELSLSGGELRSVTLALQRIAPGGIGSDGEEVSKGCALIDGSDAKNGQRAQGDVVLIAMVFAAMTARHRRKQ